MAGVNLGRWTCSPCICIAARRCWWNSNTQQWRLPVRTTQRHQVVTTTPDQRLTTSTSRSPSTSPAWAALRVSVGQPQICAPARSSRSAAVKVNVSVGGAGYSQEWTFPNILTGTHRYLTKGYVFIDYWLNIIYIRNYFILCWQDTFNVVVTLFWRFTSPSRSVCRLGNTLPNVLPIIRNSKVKQLFYT